jgi:hypothetical protein
MLNDHLTEGSMEIDWITDLDAALAAAKSARRPLIIDFWGYG